jgi:hypothetical protein
MECLNGRTFSKCHYRFVLNHFITIMSFLILHLWIKMFIVMVDTWPSSHINYLVDYDKEDNNVYFLSKLFFENRAKFLKI